MIKLSMIGILAFFVIWGVASSSVLAADTEGKVTTVALKCHGAN